MLNIKNDMEGKFAQYLFNSYLNGDKSFDAKEIWALMFDILYHHIGLQPSPNKYHKYLLERSVNN